MKKRGLARKGVAFLLVCIMTSSAVGGGGGPGLVKAGDKFPGYVSDESLAHNSTEAPAIWGAVPDANQYKYQKDELAAFCHFGPNTFNEVEWGEHYGDKAPEEIFKLEEDFDADTLAESVKDAGFKKIIVTAKHHDGFCIWASGHTTYDVAETSYKNGEGDILEEISAACTKYNLDMGLYLSPWDIHDPSYGYYDENRQPTDKEHDALDYNEYYDNQLKEILSDSKYGNDGHFVEVWMDGAKGSGANAQEYDFARWFKTIQTYEGKAAGFEADCMLFGAGAYTTVRWIGNESGFANEETWSKSRVNYDKNTIDSNHRGEYSIGYRDGNQWTVPECDARITSGWFWGNTKKTPKSIADLADMYFRSVGHNGTMLLNIPPNDKGTVDDTILDRVQEFGENVSETFGTNLALDAAVYATEVRGNDTAFKPSNVLDSKADTYWTMNDDTEEGSLIFDLGKSKTFDIVSIEEAIQFGQRIEGFKVEYRNGDSDSWKTFGQGTTVGGKRLSRSSAVKADQLKITVTSSPGKPTIDGPEAVRAVPMISEVGVYKASEGFELTGTVPEGMEVIDVSDTDTADGAGFTFGAGWTNENNPKYVQGTNKYAYKGAEFTLKFHGTQASLIGTRDPNHGKADIYVDGKLEETIDTSAGARSVGQIIYTTKELEDTDHTIRLVVSSKAIGVEAAYVLNNGGAGRLELENTKYIMEEDSTLQVKITREGGAEGKVEALLEPNPGTAVQDDFVAEPVKVTLEDGQRETTAEIKTRRNTNETGDQYFSAELTDPTNNAIVGFNGKARVTIIDTEGMTRGKLEELVEECSTILKEHCISGWDELYTKVTQTQAILDKEDATREDIIQAYEELKEAKENLVYRNVYSEEDPFIFPWTENSGSTLEAEFSILKNTGVNEQWPLQIAQGDWASNGKFVNCLNKDDTITIPYKADKPGVYKVTATYRSGSNNNKLSWSEPEGKIENGQVSAGNADASVVKTVEFDMTVKEPGAGNLVFTAPQGDSPQLDKLYIEPENVVLNSYSIVAQTEGEGGTILPAGETIVKEGSNQTYQITAAEGFAIGDVVVNGQSVGAVDSYTFSNVTENCTITASFTFRNYTPTNPYYFPTTVDEGKQLEAENFILTNTGENETWVLQISSADWASKGEFVNAMNVGDKVSLPYYADKAGKYQVMVTFRSGDPNNGLNWAEVNEKIQAGYVTAGAGDQAAETHTKAFALNVVTPGAGILVFTAPKKNAPQLDKFDLVLKEEWSEAEVDKTELNAAIAEAQAKLEEEDKYTLDSIKRLKEALTIAETIWAEQSATKEQVDEALVGLTKAINGLEEIVIEKPDKSALYTAIAEAQSRLANAHLYTQASVAALEEALESAQAVAADEGANQEQIHIAKNNLDIAIKGLKEKEPEMVEGTLLHNGDGTGCKIEISGMFSKDAILNVSLIQPEEDVYQELKAQIPNSMEHIGAFRLSITGEAKGSFTITFDVGTLYNGRKVTVYHKKPDGEIEMREAVVTNGKVTITVDSLSPFMIAAAPVKDHGAGDQGNGNQNTNKPTNPQWDSNKAVKTGDDFAVIPLLIVCMLAGGAALFIGRKKKLS